MEHHSVTDYLRTLDGSPAAEDWGELRRLHRLLGLRHSPQQGFYESNWWRGPLLYCLVRRLRPRVLLEFGTGRGYGAACMAQALLDAQIDGTVYTIDVVPANQPLDWAIDEGNGPEIKQYSRNQVWNKHLPSALRQRIHCIAGSSREVTAQWKSKQLPNVDFGFIDAGHSYWEAKQDFLSVLQIANPGCAFVFDDYTTRRGFGVDRLLNDEVASRLRGGRLTAIDMLSKDYPAAGASVDHLMAVLALDAAAPTAALFSPWEIRAFSFRRTLHEALARVYHSVRQH